MGTRNGSDDNAHGRRVNRSGTVGSALAVYDGLGNQRCPAVAYNALTAEYVVGWGAGGSKPPASRGKPLAGLKQPARAWVVLARWFREYRKTPGQDAA